MRLGQILDLIIIHPLESHFYGYAKPSTVLLIQREMFVV